jgi:hypothetical protein
MANNNNLLFEYKTPDGYGGALRIEPKSNTGYINIVKDYPWTISPASIRNAIPYIELEEYRQNFSSELISLVQNLAGNAQNIYLSGPSTATSALTNLLIGKAITGAATGAGNVVVEGAAQAAELAARRFNPGLAIALGNAVRGAGSSLLTTGVGAVRVLRNQVIAYNTAAESLDNINKNIGPEMDPYSKLYSAVKTGFTYRLPFINTDNFMDAGGTWGPANEKGAVTGGLEAVKTLLTRKKSQSNQSSEAAQFGYDFFEGIDKISKGLIGAAPGVAAETLKSFVPKADGESVKITFYLSNTLGSDPASIRKNWELLYLLTYQNLPNRRSINLLDPPCLYRVTIPGLKTYPVAVIDSLKITNEGILRRINLQTGEIVTNESGPEVKVIPEVYKITMTVKSLLTSTQNIFYYAQANESKVNVITENFSAIDVLKNATNGTVTTLEQAISPIDIPNITP